MHFTTTVTGDRQQRPRTTTTYRLPNNNHLNCARIPIEEACLASMHASPPPRGCPGMLQQAHIFPFLLWRASQRPAPIFNFYFFSAASSSYVVKVAWHRRHQALARAPPRRLATTLKTDHLIRAAAAAMVRIPRTRFNAQEVRQSHAKRGYAKSGDA